MLFATRIVRCFSSLGRFNDCECTNTPHSQPTAYDADATNTLAQNNLLRSLRSQHGARLRLRAERGPSPQELVKQASLAARLQDLDIIRLEAGIERREPAQWDELRVWDPGDG